MDFQYMGVRIRQVRRSRGLTQAQLAGRIGKSSTYVTQIERGKRKASVDTLVAICRTLGTSPDELVLSNADKALLEGRPAEELEAAAAFLERLAALCRWEADRKRGANRL